MYMLSGMGVLIDFDQQSLELSVVGNNLDLGHLPLCCCQHFVIF